jgi:hypothetical protein
MLPKSLEVILKLFRSSWSGRWSTWSNGGMSSLTLDQWRVTLELWRFTQELWRHALELWRLSFLNFDVMFE